jgi:hypothetical protein
MFRTSMTRHLLRPTNALPRTHAFHPTTLKPLSTSTPLSARKGAEDKDSLQPRRSEYSQTGGDDAAAENSDAAFNPNKTRPEEEVDTAGTNKKDNPHGGNPLDVSPGNTDVSKPSSGENRKAENTNEKRSGAGSAPKAGGAKSG